MRRGGKHGLSPLARGTPTFFLKFVINSRFIPAGAGNTVILKRVVRWLPVYPRWRGEHRVDTDETPMAHGLSPLARGTRPDLIADFRALRFIPAGAGNTTPISLATLLPPVYPRWRGEHVHGQ
ncbi:hypothetical protein SENTW_3029 [Salmonella enterica subsp. enterica serovar Weltevreden str. 2007-60-3289-1]|nr:hypothetical protein SENTW_3029 [Salmonella enterica subsp. enterica serovar Weltevreden str. 2007-60-3289-1]